MALYWGCPSWVRFSFTSRSASRFFADARSRFIVTVCFCWSAIKAKDEPDLFAGLFFCEACGTSMLPKVSQQKYFYYNCAHFKHSPDNRRSFLVNNQLVLIVRMPQVAVGVECAKIFTAPCFGMERGLDFCAVYVEERNLCRKHGAGTAVHAILPQ